MSGLTTQILILCFIQVAVRVEAAAGGSDFFPGFNTDVSQYTVRYVKSSGEDTEECLHNQPYPPPSGCQSSGLAGSAVTHCRSIGYSLLEGCMNRNCTPNVTRNLIVLFYPGTYEYGENRGVEVYDFTNLVIRRVPMCDESREVVFSCTKLTESFYNNLYIVRATNLSIDGIVLANCGPKSPGAAIDNVHNAFFTNCEFR